MEFDNDNLCVIDVLQYIEQLEAKVKELEKEKQIEIAYDNYIDANVIEETYETLGRLNCI